MTAFSGTGLPSPLLLDFSSMASPLLNATLPAPTAMAGVFQIFPVKSVTDSWVTQQPYLLSKTGIKSPAHGLVWFDHIHVEPRIKNLGFVLSDQNFTAEVWNGYMERAQTLIDITINGPSGVQLIGAPSIPTAFAGSRSIVYNLQATTQGSPFIDNDVVWTFIGIDPAGTDMLITGTRLVPFSISPNWASPIVEGYGFYTDIILAFDDTEQRVQLKSTARRSMEFEVLCVDERESQLLHSLLYGWQSRPYGVPWWQDSTALTAPITAGVTLISLNTTNLDFQVGGLAMIWADASTWEVLTITTISSTQLGLSTGTKYSWPVAGSRIMPMRLGRLSESENMQWESLQYASMQMNFDIEAFSQ